MAPWVRVEKRMGLGVETLTFGCGETMGWVGGGSDQWEGRGGMGCKTVERFCSRTPSLSCARPRRERQELTSCVGFFELSLF
jgi:hypothetical protein